MWHRHRRKLITLSVLAGGVVGGVLLPMGTFVLAGHSQFLHFTWEGVSTTQRTYTREVTNDDGNWVRQSVLLIPCIHMGKREFYENVASQCAARGTLTLLEGACFRQAHTSSLVFLIDWFCSMVDRLLGIDGWRLISRGLGEGGGMWSSKARNFDMGDDFVGQDSYFWGRPLHRIGADIPGIANMGWEMGDGFPFSFDVFRTFDERNEHLLSVMWQVLDGDKHKYDKIMVPWGALHMACFSKSLEKSGFREDIAQRNTHLVIERQVVGRLASVVGNMASHTWHTGQAAVSKRVRFHWDDFQERIGEGAQTCQQRLRQFYDNVVNHT